MWVTKEVAAPAPAAWELFTDTFAWPRWGPPIAGVASSERRLGPGTRGRVRTVLGVTLPFQVTAFDPGRSWSWRVAGIPATGHRVEELGPERCRIGFDVPTPFLGYVGVCRWALQRMAEELEAESRRPAA